MKITNLDKGKTYQLGEGAKLEVERTNPFFNDYGETTTPLDIPASDYNRMILGYPDTFGLREKMVAANVSIEDGEYFAQCRQIVLSAQHKGNISSSFYINDGSFYSKIQNVKLKSIFKDEMIPGCSTLDECISFCRSLIGGKNENCIHFLGAVPNEQVLQAMRQHDIFLFTSDSNEGWGAVANESMSQGCVLVGSDAIGSIPFLVKHRQNGLVFRSCQVDSLVEEAEWLITHPQEMRRMQRAAVSTMQEIWSPRNAARQFLQLVGDLENGRECSVMEGPGSKE